MNRDLLVHLTHGPDKPTEADRAFLIAQTAVEEGFGVAMFLAGAAVDLLSATHLDAPLGYGPPLRERFDIILAARSAIYVSRVSCESRGIDPATLHPAAMFAPPSTLVHLTMEYARTITYG